MESEIALIEKIEQAFSDQKKPSTFVVESRLRTPEAEDALWFVGRDWKDVTREDWDEHPEAFHTFTSEAFSYFLPSVVTISLKDPIAWFEPADALIQLLDRSPNQDYWDEFFVSRFSGLTSKDYKMLQGWLICLSGYGQYSWPNTIDRAFDTLVLLAEDARRTCD